MQRFPSKQTDETTGSNAETAETGRREPPPRSSRQVSTGESKVDTHQKTEPSCTAVLYSTLAAEAVKR